MNYEMKNGLAVPAIPPTKQEEINSLEDMVYCRETHDLCDQGCKCKADCKRKAERLAAA